MKKGITSFFGYHQPMEENIKQIKNAGFDRVMCATDTKYEKQNGTLDSQVNLIKKYGLELGSLHAKYDEDIAEMFFEEGETGEKITKDFMDDILLCEKYGFTCLVMHIYGKPSEVGAERFSRIVKFAKEHNVILAVENLIDLAPFDYLLERFTDENVKVCLDIGHRNCFSRDNIVYEKYGDRIITTHLHDNDGLYDLHTTTLLAKNPDTKTKYPDSKVYQTSRQNVNFDEFVECVKKYNLDIALDYELNNNIMGCDKISPEDMLRQCYIEAKELGRKIFRHTNKLNYCIETTNDWLSAYAWDTDFFAVYNYAEKKWVPASESLSSYFHDYPDTIKEIDESEAEKITNGVLPYDDYERYIDFFGEVFKKRKKNK